MEKSYDLTYIEEISMGDSKIKDELITMFIESSEIFIKNLRSFFTENQWDNLHKLIHSYSSEIGMFGPNESLKQMLNIMYNYKGEKNKKEEISVIVEELEIKLRKIIISLTSERGD